LAENSGEQITNFRAQMNGTNFDQMLIQAMNQAAAQAKRDAITHNTPLVTWDHKKEQVLEISPKMLREQLKKTKSKTLDS
jgi:hypothetical protein